MITFTFHIYKAECTICTYDLPDYASGSDHPEALCVAMEILDLATDCPASAVSNQYFIDQCGTLAGKCSCAQPHSRHTNSPHASRRCGHLRCSADSCILSWKNDRSVKFHCLRLRPFTALCMDLADRRHHIGKLTYPALPVLALASATLELSGSRSRYFAAVPGDLPEHANQTSTKASD